MDDSLIIDVGMHAGNDSEFYLKKGFKVIGIEADPVLSEKAGNRLIKYVNNSRLLILNIAINNYNGITNFYTCRAHDDWGTLLEEFVDRNKNIYGTKHEKIKVKCRRFEDVLEEYGIPYYLKVDIEGLDILCLRALFSVDVKPAYVSTEPDQQSFEGFFSHVAILWELGYRKFKIINQAQNAIIKCPNPPSEGEYVEHKFDGLSSGPFGEETPGKWMTVGEIIDKYNKILRMQYLFGTKSGWQGKYKDTIIQKIFNIYLKMTNEFPLGWYDLHAKLCNGLKR